MTNTSGCCYSL